MFATSTNHGIGQVTPECILIICYDISKLLPE